MTLVLNEIHVGKAFNRSFVVAAADRQILLSDGTGGGKRKKVFLIPHLTAAISYFGLAAWTVGARLIHLSDWLPAFIQRNGSCRNLMEFAEQLRVSLNQMIPPSLLATVGSGFHVVGFDQERRPDFWFVTNIGSMTGFTYTDFQPRFGDPASHFLQRDAAQLNWDGGLSIQAGVSVYRNGDIRSHVVAWETLDRILTDLTQFPDFRAPQNHAEYRDYVKFKFDILAYYYKHWARRRTIAGPIDVFLLEQPAIRP